MTAVHAPPADGLQRAYDAWAPLLVPALRTAPVWIDPSFASGLGPDFAEALDAAVEDSPIDVRVAVGPEIERPPETDLRFCDRLFARLIDDLGHTGPLIFAYFTPSGRTTGVWSYASGPTGMSSRLTTRGEMSALRGSFVLDPRPHVDYCIAAGLHWLGDAEAPELSSYVDGRFGPEVASFFEMHRAGGVNALAAGTTFITAGAALAWVLMRRRAAAEAAGTGTPGRAGTPRLTGTSGTGGVSFAQLRARLPALLHADAPRELADAHSEPADAAATPEALDAAEHVNAVRAAAQTVRSRIRPSAGTQAESGETADDLRALIDAAAITDIAALTILDRLTAVFARQAAGEDIPTPRWCFFNPLHGETQRSAVTRSRHGGVSVPACIRCEQRLDRGEDPETLLVVPATGGRPVPYYAVDDGYARTGMGAFAPIWTDIPARPAVRPGIVTTRTGPPSRARTITTSAAAVALAGLIGAGLGAAGSAVITAASVPAFDTTAGAHSTDYPAERIDGIAEALAGDPVYLDPSVTAAYTPQTRTALHDIIDDAPAPLRIVATHMNSSDESGGDRILLAGRIAAETGEDCVVIVIEPNGTSGIAATGYDLGTSTPADLTAADSGLGTDVTPDERLIAVAEAAAELDIRADPAAAPELRTQPLGEVPETGPQIGGVPEWNLLRGAAAGFAGSVVTIGLGGVFMLASRGRRLAADPINEEAHTPWAD